MLSYFPTPYPDELVYSILSRCCEKSGFLSYIHAAKQILRNPLDRPRPEFINAYTDQTNIMLTYNMSREEIIFSHTMFSCFARFLPYERRNDALNAILKNSPDSINKLAYPKNKSAGKRFLRYCPICADEDRHLYGETYWHRDHQIFGLTICSKHYVNLVESNVEIGSKASPGFISAEECISMSETIQCKNDVQQRLARYVGQVFHSPIDMDNKVSVGEFLNSKLAGTSYLSIRGQMRNMTLLESDFREYYRDLPDNRFTDLAQIQKVFSAKRTNMVEVCMLAMFLGVSAEELMQMELPSEDRTVAYDRRIAELKQQGLNYRQIAGIVGGCYDYVKIIGEKTNCDILPFSLYDFETNDIVQTVCIISSISEKSKSSGVGNMSEVKKENPPMDEARYPYIQPNRYVKDYPSLCAIFGFKPTTGSAKQNQLIEMQRYAKITPASECPKKCGGAKRGYYIKKVYSSPLPNYELSTERSYIAAELKPALCHAILERDKSTSGKIVQIWNPNELLGATRMLSRMPEMLTRFQSNWLLERRNAYDRLSEEEEAIEKDLSLLLEDYLFVPCRKSIRSCLTGMMDLDGAISYSYIPYTYPLDAAEDDEDYDDIEEYDEMCEPPEGLYEESEISNQLYESYYTEQLELGTDLDELVPEPAESFYDILEKALRESPHPSIDEEILWWNEAKQFFFKKYNISGERDLFSQKFSLSKRRQFYRDVQNKLKSEHNILIAKVHKIVIRDRNILEANLPKPDDAKKLQKKVYTRRLESLNGFLNNGMISFGDKENKRRTYANELHSLYYVYILGKPIPKNLKTKNCVKIREF